MQINPDGLTIGGVESDDAEAIARAVADGLLDGISAVANDASSRDAYSSKLVADYWADRDPLRFDPEIGGEVADRLRGVLVAVSGQAWETAQSEFEEAVLGMPNRRFALPETRGAVETDPSWVERAVNAVLRGSVSAAASFPDAVHRGVAAAIAGPFGRTQ